MSTFFRRVFGIFSCFSRKSKSAKQPKNEYEYDVDHGIPTPPDTPLQEKTIENKTEFNISSSNSDHQAIKIRHERFELVMYSFMRYKTDVEIEASSIKTDLRYAMNPLQGGFGSVTMGYLKGEQVAIKKSLRKNCPDLRKECDLLRFISHPNVLKYLGVIRDNRNGVSSLITEWCEGGDLTTYFNNNWWKISSFNIIDIALQISLGMNYLHEVGIIHRDLKGDNVYININHISKWQAKFIVKIGDFGCSTTKYRANRGQHSRVGTEVYMSPEVLNPKNYPGIKEIYSNKSDVYSFGLLLYHILSGSMPFYFLSEEQIIDKIKRKKLKCRWDLLMKLCLKCEVPNFVFYIGKLTTSYVINERPEFVKIIEFLTHAKCCILRDLEYSIVNIPINTNRKSKQLIKIKLSQSYSFP